MKAYPLHWPADRPRCRRPESPKTTVSLAQARTHLLKQLQMLGAIQVVLSSNAVLRKDGLPMSKQPVWITDKGVAVWFHLRGYQPQYCISCDLNTTIAANVRAIGMAVADVRGITSRLGIRINAFIQIFLIEPDTAGSHLHISPDKKAPRPSAKRPPASSPSAGSWRDVLEVGRVAPWGQIQENYLRLTRINEHMPAELAAIEAAYAVAKEKFGFK